MEEEEKEVKSFFLTDFFFLRSSLLPASKDGGARTLQYIHSATIVTQPSTDKKRQKRVQRAGLCCCAGGPLRWRPAFTRHSLLIKASLRTQQVQQQRKAENIKNQEYFEIHIRWGGKNKKKMKTNRCTHAQAAHRSSSSRRGRARGCCVKRSKRGGGVPRQVPRCCIPTIHQINPLSNSYRTYKIAKKKQKRRKQKKREREKNDRVSHHHPPTYVFSVCEYVHVIMKRGRGNTSSTSFHLRVEGTLRYEPTQKQRGEDRCRSAKQSTHPPPPPLQVSAAMIAARHICREEEVKNKIAQKIIAYRILFIPRNRKNNGGRQTVELRS